jgi:hypothetical protein
MRLTGERDSCAGASAGKDRKAFLPGGVGETIIQSHEWEIRGPLFARGQEGGELKCVRGPQDGRTAAAAPSKRSSLCEAAANCVSSGSPARFRR